MKNNTELVECTIKGIKSSYGSKYSDQDYVKFRVLAQTIKTKSALISLVSNFFDLDFSDAKDMVE